jgi:hypothetical protein
MGASSTGNIEGVNTMEKNLFILLKQEFDGLPPTVEGYFDTVQEATSYISQNGYDELDFQLYKLESNKDYIA